MKRTILLFISAFALSLAFAACTNEEGDISGKPGFMQQHDSISNKPPMGDTANTGG